MSNNALTSRWQIDGQWLVSTLRRTHLARLTPDGLALWDKHARAEVVLSAADIEAVLSECGHDPPGPDTPRPSSDP